MIAKLPSSTWRRSSFFCLAFALSALAAFVVGCGGKIPATHYYTLKFPPPTPSADPKTSLVLEIEPFKAAMNLRDDRLIYYESPTEFSYYEYHRWSPDPATMLTELTRRRLIETDVFAHIQMNPSHQPTDYTLKGRLLNFDELDYESGGKARVTLDMRLVRSRDQKTVWSDRREVMRPIDQKGVDGVVNALNAASDQLLGEALPGLSAAVERDSKESPAKPQ